MLKVNMSQTKIQEVKAQYKNTITKESVINIYEQHMEDIQVNNTKFNKTIRNNVVSGLIVLGMQQEFIEYCMYELDLTDLLENNTIEEINNMFEME